MERTEELVELLNVWYRSNSARQCDLAGVLELTPQALSEILSRRNRPNSETTLRILDFLTTENAAVVTFEQPIKTESRKFRNHVVIDGNRVVSGQLAAALGKHGLPNRPAGTAAPKAFAPKSGAKRSRINDVLSRFRTGRRKDVAQPTAKPATKSAALPEPEPAPVFSQTALAYFNMAANTLKSTDTRDEGKRLLLAQHYLKSSGDPFISSINPIELLKEIKAEAKQ
jgi:hypothetical protein